MIVTCPSCGQRLNIGEFASRVACRCGCRFSPSDVPTAADPWLGREVCGCRIEEVVGTGGMGTVYRATQLSLDRRVAVKVLPDEIVDDAFIERFHREARILATLSHPNIVSVFDRGEIEGRYCIVMEFVDGRSLRELMAKGRLQQKEACRVATALLDALDHAHAEGIVHRDIKPESVLIAKDGTVKVKDFGLSRVFAGEQEEQREGTRYADARSDVSATAALFYEMLTGELPTGRFQMPSLKVPGIDARLDRIFARGLRGELADRYQRASEMGREVASLANAAEAPEEEAPKPAHYDSRLDLLLTVLAIAGLGMIGIGLFLLLDNSRFEIGFYELDRGLAGLAVLAYGFSLWRAAEQTRRFSSGARSLLFVLTALALPTFVALPLTIWAWLVLLQPKMRIYFDARVRGLDAIEAARLAHGLDPEPRKRPEVAGRRAAAALANRRMARFWGALAGVALLIALLVLLDDLRIADEQGFLIPLGAGIALALGSLYFAYLAREVRARRRTKLNARTWSLLAGIAPKAARRARMLCRDEAAHHDK